MMEQQDFFACLAAFLKDEEGATAIEYGLVIALIAIAIVGGVSSIGGRVESTFNNLSTELDAVTPEGTE